MAAHNEHTGDAIQTRTITDAYREGFDRVFGKKKKDEPATTTDDTTGNVQPTDTEPDA